MEHRTRWKIISPHIKSLRKQQFSTMKIVPSTATQIFTEEILMKEPM